LYVLLPGLYVFVPGFVAAFLFTSLSKLLWLAAIGNFCGD
jgi:hypothetical protein